MLGRRSPVASPGVSPSCTPWQRRRETRLVSVSNRNWAVGAGFINLLPPLNSAGRRGHPGEALGTQLSSVPAFTPAPQRLRRSETNHHWSVRTDDRIRHMAFPEGTPSLTGIVPSKLLSVVHPQKMLSAVSSSSLPPAGGQWRAGRGLGRQRSARNSTRPLPQSLISDRSLAAARAVGLGGPCGHRTDTCPGHSCSDGLNCSRVFSAEC